MKSSYLLPTALVAALFVASCDNEHAILPTADDLSGNVVTFNLRTPKGENVIYGRAIHDEAEFAINSLTLYEYEVTEEGSVLTRIMKKDGNGQNNLDLYRDADNGYTFSIIVPAENNGKQYSYKFVANDLTDTPALGSSFDDFKATNAKIALADDKCTADVLAGTTDEEGNTVYGIAMSGVAKDDAGSEVITMQKGASCTVTMTRIVSRIDISYQTPNLKVTNIYLSGAPANGTLFPADELPAAADSYTLGINANVSLPEAFLQDSEDDAVELKKAFYVYERANTADDCMSVHIDYEVKTNGSDKYVGSVEVPFCKKDEEGNDVYVDALRNHLYKIVLGNGTDPISGKVSVRLFVNEWTGVDINEPLTDDDPVKE